MYKISKRLHLKSIEIYCKFVAGVSGSGGNGETKDRGEGRKYGAGDNVDRNGGAEKSGWGQYIEYVV